MNKYIVWLAIAFLSICSNTAHGVERSCKADGSRVVGLVEVGSAWIKIHNIFPTAYNQSSSANRTSPEAARKNACQLAAKSTAKYAQSKFTKVELAKLLCRVGRVELADRNKNAGRAGIKLQYIYAYTTREHKSHKVDLGDATFNCTEIVKDVPSSLASPDFCQKYSTTSIKMDQALDALGCSVRHYSKAEHKNWCSQRQESPVLKELKKRRTKLNNCISGLPLNN